jgi:oligopeptide transport system permease protein
MPFFLQKFATLLLSLLVVLIGTFFLMHAIPGDPFIGDRIIPEEVLRSLYAYYGLDKPLWVQFLLYLKGIFTLDLGTSIVYPGKPVLEFLKQGFPISFLLGLQALFLAIPCGILLGTWAALKRSKWQDSFAMTLSTLFVSVPSFVFASLLQYVFAVHFSLLPVARWGTFQHTLLPTLALAALPMAYTARLTRSNMVEVLQQDYIRTAVAKGLPPLQVALRHGLRNALLPVIAYLGPVVSSVLTGSFVVEKIFAIPGLGQWMIHSIQSRDYPLILGLTLFYSALLMTLLFIADLLYLLLDPRIRRERHE